MIRTQRQREVYNIVCGWIDLHGAAPSYADIALNLGVNSRATIAKHVSALARQGVLVRERNSAGAFVLRPPMDGERVTPEPYKLRYRPSIPAALRWEVMERDNFTCKKCGIRRFLEVDHVIAYSKGGLTVAENLQTLCNRCNQRKAAS